MEFSLLELLVSRSGAVSRSEILQKWGYTPERHVDTRVVDVHISRLRAKLEDDPSNPELILTARGTGCYSNEVLSQGGIEGWIVHQTSAGQTALQVNFPSTVVYANLHPVVIIGAMLKVKAS